MTTTTIRILLADDHPVVRHGLERILVADPAITVVGAATSFATLLDALQTTPVDVLVLDLGGMAAPPLSMVVQLQRDYPQLPCVVFSSSVDLAPEVRREGVLGYVVKEEMESHLLTAIHAAALGKVYVSPIVQAYLDQSAAVRREYHLTLRELTTLKLVAQGKSTEAIAEEMEIDPRTAQNYIGDLYDKTGCDERTQLVQWYRARYYDRTS